MKSFKSIFLVLSSFTLLCVLQLHSQTPTESKRMITDESERMITAATEARSALIESAKYLDDPANIKFRTIKMRYKIFEATYRSSKSVSANIKAGITFQEYGNLIRPFISDVAVLEDEISSDDEKYLYEAYLSVTKIYSTEGSFWSEVIHSGNPEIKETSNDLISGSWSVASQILEKANEAYLRNKKSKTIKHK